jgi:hypothetical protein
MKLMREGTLKKSKEEKTKTIGMQIMSRLAPKKRRTMQRASNKAVTIAGIKR